MRLARHHSRAVVSGLSQYSVVLLLIVSIYLLVAVLPPGRVSQTLVVAVQASTFLFALLATRPRRSVAWVGVALALVAVGVAVAGTAVLDDARGLIAVMGAGLLSLALGAVLVQLVTESRASIQLVLGAIDAYLLIGLLFAFVFAAFGSQTGNLAAAAASEATNGDYLVYSYASLTTLGDAPLVSQNNLVSTFTVLEAMVGQIFLVTVIARLVALWASPAPAERQGADAAEQQPSQRVDHVHDHDSREDERTRATARPQPSTSTGAGA